MAPTSTEAGAVQEEENEFMDIEKGLLPFGYAGPASGVDSKMKAERKKQEAARKARLKMIFAFVMGLCLTLSCILLCSGKDEFVSTRGSLGFFGGFFSFLKAKSPGPFGGLGEETEIAQIDLDAEIDKLKTEIAQFRKKRRDFENSCTTPTLQSPQDRPDSPLLTRPNEGTKSFIRVPVEPNCGFWGRGYLFCEQTFWDESGKTLYRSWLKTEIGKREQRIKHLLSRSRESCICNLETGSEGMPFARVLADKVPDRSENLVFVKFLDTKGQLLMKGAFEREREILKRVGQLAEDVSFEQLLRPPEKGPCIIMKYLAGTNLEKYIEERQNQLRGKADESRRTKMIFRELVSHVKRLHEPMNGLRVVHRDLKPDNILICEADKSKGCRNVDAETQAVEELDSTTVIVVDYGWSSFYARGRKNVPNDPLVFRCRYQAPEESASKNDRLFCGGFGLLGRARIDPEKCDIFALGLILIDLIFGMSSETDDIRWKIYNRTKFGDVYSDHLFRKQVTHKAEALIELIESMTEYNPARRSSLNEVERAVDRWLDEKEPGLEAESSEGFAKAAADDSDSEASTQCPESDFVGEDSAADDDGTSWLECCFGG